MFAFTLKCCLVYLFAAAVLKIYLETFVRSLANLLKMENE